ncbi:MAG: hypothetical protein OEW18_06885 [Candidatus Aminicenantes bacterium]|nr:hypothetical protein [Candidatus Aminicenantes bacterium]
MKPNRVYDNILEGIGDEFLIGCVEFDLMDDILRVDDRLCRLGHPLPQHGLQ